MLEVYITLLILGILLGLSIATAYSSFRLGKKRDRVIILPRNGVLIRKPENKRDYSNLWLSEWLHGLSTEMTGAIITTAFLGLVLLFVQRYDAEQTKRADLTLQMGSPDNGFAVEAVRQMEVHGWTNDGTLRGSNLPRANLRGLFLLGADLQEANLARAILEDANLWNSNLQGANLAQASLLKARLSQVMLQNANLSQADLREADLNRANLINANLRGANLQLADLSKADITDTVLEEAILTQVNLSGANLSDADLSRANMQGADLRNADLHGAILWRANLRGSILDNRTLFDENTVLPDGKNDISTGSFTAESYWTPETDMSKYTNPDHPEFWTP